MSFAENLKQMRKEKGLSQEKLAEIMSVSRQAISKWELGEGYPEVEKLLLLADTLEVSLDVLMAREQKASTPAKKEVKEDAKPKVTGSIVISSPYEKTSLTCEKVMSSNKMKGNKKSPQFSLLGVEGDKSPAFLGWYANEETIAKEIAEITEAIAGGVPTYELKYSVKAIKKWGRLVIV